MALGYLDINCPYCGFTTNYDSKWILVSPATPGGPRWAQPEGSIKSEHELTKHILPGKCVCTECSRTYKIAIRTMTPRNKRYKPWSRVETKKLG